MFYLAKVEMNLGNLSSMFIEKILEVKDKITKNGNQETEMSNKSNENNLNQINDKESKKEENVKEEVREEKATKSNDLENLTVAELREMAKDKDVKGYSTMKKAELLDALK